MKRARPALLERLLLAGVLVVSLPASSLLHPSGTAHAAADEGEEEARRRFKKGGKLFDEGKFREAAHEFEAGYAVLPRAGFLLNIAQSYRRAGDLRKAKRYYELFLQADHESMQKDEVLSYVKEID